MASLLFKLTPMSEKGVSCNMTQGQCIQAGRGYEAKLLNVSLMKLGNNKGHWLGLVICSLCLGVTSNTMLLEEETQGLTSLSKIGACSLA